MPSAPAKRRFWRTGRGGRKSSPWAHESASGLCCC